MNMNMSGEWRNHQECQTCFLGLKSSKILLSLSLLSLSFLFSHSLSALFCFQAHLQKVSSVSIIYSGARTWPPTLTDLLWKIETLTNWKQRHYCRLTAWRGRREFCGMMGHKTWRLRLRDWQNGWCCSFPSCLQETAGLCLSRFFGFRGGLRDFPSLVTSLCTAADNCVTGSRNVEISFLSWHPLTCLSE